MQLRSVGVGDNLHPIQALSARQYCPQDSFPPETRSELNFRDFNTTVFQFGVNSVAAGPPIFEAFAHKQEKVELWEALPPYSEDIEQKLEQQLNLHPYHFSGKAESSKVVHDCFCAAP